MCGRYTIIAKAEEIEKRFNVEVPTSYIPRYNAAPAQVLPVITNARPEGLSFFHWGLIPQWAKDKSISSKLINARSETITEKASFRNALQKRRCLVIADGFYEWKKSFKKSKIPYRIHLKDSSLFAFAGLWEEYDDDEQNRIHTFTIITTMANPIISKIHDRMPVILDRKSEQTWLDPMNSLEDLMKILKPYDEYQMDYYSVSSQVNLVQNDNPQLIMPTPPADQFGNLTLFD
jgi:putative SOS response-associated peptidase YedK